MPRTTPFLSPDCYPSRIAEANAAMTLETPPWGRARRLRHAGTGRLYRVREACGAIFGNIFVESVHEVISSNPSGIPPAVRSVFSAPPQTKEEGPFVRNGPFLLCSSTAAESLPELLQKIMPRDAFRAVTHDVVRCHLAIDQLAMPRFQPFHQADQRQLGRMGAQVEHGFPEKRPPQPDAVQAAHERISGRIMLRTLQRNGQNPVRAGWRRHPPFRA